MFIIKKCLSCEKEIKVSPRRTKDGRGKYCSRECANKSMIKKIKRNCLTCGKEFTTHPCKIRKGYGKYCSNKCRPPNRGQKGKTASIETRQKMSKAKVGPKNAMWRGGRSLQKGYVVIYSPTHPFHCKRKCVSEHRLIVEKNIGAYLSAENKVHHVDRNKINNSPRNLMAFTSESAHQRFHHNPLNVKPEEIIFDGRIKITQASL